jgi:hypothetical protein
VITINGNKIDDVSSQQYLFDTYENSPEIITINKTNAAERNSIEIILEKALDQFI